jgi:hypothetical protein
MTIIGIAGICSLFAPLIFVFMKVLYDYGKSNGWVFLVRVFLYSAGAILAIALWLISSLWVIDYGFEMGLF